MPVLAFAAIWLFAAVDGRAAADRYFHDGLFRESASAYLQLLRATPDDPDLLHGAGLSFLALSAPAQAIPFFQREIVVNPFRRDASRSLSLALGEAGRFDEAYTLLTRLASSDPSDLESWARLGVLLYRAGYYAAAIDSLRHALGPQTEPMRNRLEVLLAISLVQTGQLSLAAQALPPLLARAENAADLDLLLSQVRLLYETGLYEDALRTSDRALAADSRNAAVHFWRARLFQQNNNIGQAVAEAERSRELSPTSPAPRGLLVRLYAKSGRAAESAREAAWLRQHEAAQERQPQ